LKEIWTTKYLFWLVLRLIQIPYLPLSTGTGYKLQAAHLVAGRRYRSAFVTTPKLIKIN
jgi:hypothetical protein